MLKEEVRKWVQCYVIFLFSYGELIGSFEFQEVGHAALFVDIINPQEVCIYDPGPKDSGEKKVSCYRLEEAMYKRRAGYVLIKKFWLIAEGINNEIWKYLYLKRRINLNFLLAYNYYIDDKWRYYEYR